MSRNIVSHMLAIYMFLGLVVTINYAVTHTLFEAVPESVAVVWEVAFLSGIVSYPVISGLVDRAV